MGFAEDVSKILEAVPALLRKQRAGHSAPAEAAAAAATPAASAAAAASAQTILFSATIPAWVKEVARRFMHAPATLELVEREAGQASVDVRHLVLQAPWQIRGETVGDLIRVYGGAGGKTVVFVDTKKEADELASHAAVVSAAGDAKALHGDVAQAQREATLGAFRKGALRCIVATDVAARGLDIKGVDLVIQTQPPAGRFSGRADVDSYVHRSGRTGRAGAKGTCITLFTRGQEALVKQIEAATGNTFTRIGAPQAADLIAAGGEEAVARLEAVHAEAAGLFRAAAAAAIAAGKRRGEGAETVLARALAALSGRTKQPVRRSLLSAAEGFVTYAFTAPVAMQSNRRGRGPPSSGLP